MQFLYILQLHLCTLHHCSQRQGTCIHFSLGSINEWEKHPCTIKGWIILIVQSNHNNYPLICWVSKLRNVKPIQIKGIQWFSRSNSSNNYNRNSNLSPLNYWILNHKFSVVQNHFQISLQEELSRRTHLTVILWSKIL